MLLKKCYSKIAKTESRIFLLYCTRKESKEIMRFARQHGLTTKEYVWIVTQPVIGSRLEAPQEFVPGMLGVHFETDTKALVNEIETSMTVFAHCLSRLHNDRHNQ